LNAALAHDNLRKSASGKSAQTAERSAENNMAAAFMLDSKDGDPGQMNSLEDVHRIAMEKLAEHNFPEVEASIFPGGSKFASTHSKFARWREILEGTTNMAMNDADHFGDGDQTPIEANGSADPGTTLRYLWSQGADFHPFERPYDYSNFFVACAFGAVNEVQAALQGIQGASAKDRAQLLERRESLLRMSPLLACIGGSRFFNSSAETQQVLGRLPAEYSELLRSPDHVKVAELLLRANARADAKDIAGYSCAHHASVQYATASTLQIAPLLYAHGADFNTKNRFGDIPIFEPIMANKLETVKVLISQCGADPHAAPNPSVPHMSPMYMARFNPKLHDALTSRIRAKHAAGRSPKKASGRSGAAMNISRAFQDYQELGEQARDLKAIGDFDGAVGAYGKLLAHPLCTGQQKARAYHNLANALNAQAAGMTCNAGKAQLKKGIQAYRKAIQIWPSYALAHHNMALALQTIGDMDGARVAAASALKHEPSSMIYKQTVMELQGKGPLGGNSKGKPPLGCTPDLRHCASCSQASGNMKKCSRCKQVAYCSVECQNAHWQASHKAECRKLRKGAGCSSTSGGNMDSDKETAKRAFAASEAKKTAADKAQDGDLAKAAGELEAEEAKSKARARKIQEKKLRMLQAAKEKRETTQAKQPSEE
jgi:tetratricopeptide (TPR) repeat protein